MGDLRDRGWRYSRCSRQAPATQELPTAGRTLLDRALPVVVRAKRNPTGVKPLVVRRLWVARSVERPGVRDARQALHHLGHAGAEHVPDTPVLSTCPADVGHLPVPVQLGAPRSSAHRSAVPHRVSVTANIRDMTPRLKNDPVKRLQATVLACPVVGELEDDMAAAFEPWMLEHLESSAQSIRRLRQRLLQETATPTALTRRCTECSGALRGRSDQQFCSPACRQRAHRRHEHT